MSDGRVRAMSGRARAPPRAATLGAVLLALAAALPSAHAAPRLFAAPEASRGGSLCATATENRHEIADSKGAVCHPLALDQTTGCCLEPRTEVTAQTCSEDCSERECCESFARCVACCHVEVQKKIDTKEELPPVSHMHPAMWRKWLIQHATKHGGHGRETVRGESHPFPPGQDDYYVPPFEYCALRCRSNSRSTRYENEYQHLKHHCFGAAGVESVGPEDTLSPGREKLHDQAGDFKLDRGEAVALGLAKKIQRPSDGGAAKSTPGSGFLSAGRRRTLFSSDDAFVTMPLRLVEAGGVLVVGGVLARRWRRRVYSRAAKTT